MRHLPVHASACGRLNASILGWTYLAQHQLLPAQPRNRQVDGGAPRQAAGREGDRGCCWTPPAFPQAVPAIADGTPGRVLIGRSGAISLALGHECDGQRGCSTSKPLRAAQSMHAMAIHRAQAANEGRQLAIVVLCLPRPTLAVHLDSSTSMHRYLSLAAGAARDQVKPEFFRNVALVLLCRHGDCRRTHRTTSLPCPAGKHDSHSTINQRRVTRLQ